MNNSLIITTNKKRINLLKKQIKKARDERISKIDKSELQEIKHDAQKLIIKLWSIPTSIILLFTFLFSKSLFLQGLILSIIYLAILMPGYLVVDNIINIMYKKELAEGLKLDKFILEKEKEIKKLLEYNRNLETNILEQQKDNLEIIEEEKANDRVYTYIKKKYHN